jgi:hypothetical protein
MPCGGCSGGPGPTRMASTTRRKRPPAAPLPEPSGATLAQLSETWHHVSGAIADKLHVAIVGNKAEDARKLSVCAGIAADRIRDLEELPPQEASPVSAKTLALFRIIVQRQADKDPKATQRAKRLAKWLPQALQALQRLQEAVTEDRVGDVQRWAISAGIATTKVIRYAAQMVLTDADHAVIRAMSHLAYDWRHEALADVPRLLLLRGVPGAQVVPAGMALALFVSNHRPESAEEAKMARAIATAHSIPYCDNELRPGTLWALGLALRQALQRIPPEGGPA